MRMLLATVWALAAVASALCAPPSVDVPREVPATGDYVTISPKTDAKAISYVALSGVEPFPSAFLKDPKAFVLPVRGLPQGVYRFKGVASLNDEHTVFEFSVVVGKPSPPPVTPGPVDPPVTNGKLYFLVVRADGPAAPELTKAMSLPAWDGLRSAGHSVGLATAKEAAPLNLGIPSGTTLPVVVTLRVSADGKSSSIARPAVPLPTTAEGITKLPEGVK